jgi:Pvc16 N-terminal domain/Carboxypeptidase regulatory-like domain
MLDDLDATIREMLIQAGGFVPNEVDIAFDIPDREWSKQIARPTLNCYLFDIHERRALREEGWRVEDRGRPTAARRPPPLFYEITYLVTAWTSVIEDEHRLLWSALETLARFPVLNDPNLYIDSDVQGVGEGGMPIASCLRGALVDYPFPISTTVAQLEGVLRSPGEFWTALENQIKPSLSYVITLALDRRAARAGPPVLSTGIRVSLPESTGVGGFELGALFRLPIGASAAGVSVTVEDSDFRTTADERGHFSLAGLPPGRYTVRVEVGGQAYRRVVVVRDEAPRVQGYSDIILDQSGNPLAGVEVEVERIGLRAVTDHQGRFSLSIAPGHYTLRLQMDGWFQRRSITVRNESYRLTLGYGGLRPNESISE